MWGSNQEFYAFIPYRCKVGQPDALHTKQWDDIFLKQKCARRIKGKCDEYLETVSLEEIDYQAVLFVKLSEHD